ncbi:MAG: hypothetical protein ACM3S5_04445 [Rhodospirillales bacterium]|nr:hypothetical protein [Bryobacteraceae bacterium]
MSEPKGIARAEHRVSAKELLRGFVCRFLVIQVLALQALASQPQRDWNSISRLRPGRKVTVQLDRPKVTVKGAFVSADNATITVLQARGGTRLIARDTIRRVTASRGAAKSAPLIGAAAGAGTFAAIGQGWDLSGAGTAVVVAGGAAIGALIGLLIRGIRGDELIYEVPGS